VEHYGASEPYLPVLEALGRLGRGPDGEQLIAVLRQYAPTWLVHLPALVSPAEREQLQREVQGATPQRMLREMAEALEALTAERPLLLVLEDLHWSDVSTLDFLSVVARRTERARLFIIGSYRPAEVLGNGHPLRTVMQELHLHKQCEELRLGLLSEEDVTAYLRKRLSVGAHSRAPFQRLATLLHRRTEGNPLFLVSVVEDLVTQGALVPDNENWTLQEEGAMIERSVPENIRQLVARQGERLARAAQRILEAGSVAGMEFSAAAVAAALAWDVAAIEEQCAALAGRQQFLRPAGIAEWPDGTRAARYGFLHALYQQLWHERVTASQLQRWHLRIGERKEVGYGKRNDEIATELAVHFEQGRDYRRAVQYLHLAGENATRRSAHREAITLLTKGLELLKTLPDTPERRQHELGLHLTLGPVLMNIRGFAAPEVGALYTRARELCQQRGDTAQLFPVLFGLWLFSFLRAELPLARELGEQLLRLAQQAHDATLLLVAHRVLGPTLLQQGELPLAREHVEQGIALYDPQQHRPLAFVYAMDIGMTCRIMAAWVLWLLGYPDQALQRSHEAITLAQESSHPYSLGFALCFTAELHQFRREGRLAQERAEAAMAFSAEQGFAQALSQAASLRGWALAEQGRGEEGVVQIGQGLAAYRATGAEIERSRWLALLAEAHGKMGQAQEGLSVLAEALTEVEQNGIRYYEAELYRLYGQLTLQSKTSPRHVQNKSKARRGQVENKSEDANTQHLMPSTLPEAEACFHKAIEIARQQQAKSLELRAVMNLSRLWQQQGKKAEARTMLAEIYNWFTEGFDTKDLQEAKALLQELA
jgi:predicted ATPase